MLRLYTETESASSRALSVDAAPAIRKAIEHADKGLWTVRIRMPDGRRLTVSSIIRQYGLQRYVRPDLNVPDVI